MKLEEYGFKVRSVRLRKLPASGRIQKKEKNDLLTNPSSRRSYEQNDEYKANEGELTINDETTEGENKRSQQHNTHPIQINNKNEQCQKIGQVGSNQTKNKESLIEKRDLFRDITHMLGSQNKILEEFPIQSDTKQHNGLVKEEQRQQNCENDLKSLKNQNSNSVLPVRTQHESNNCISQVNQFNASHVQPLISESDSILPANGVVVIVEKNNSNNQQMFDFAATNSPTGQGKNENPPLLFNPHDDIDFIGSCSSASEESTEDPVAKSIGFFDVDWKLLETRSAYYKVNPEILLNYKCLFANFPKKRAILIDWMQEVAASLGFKRDTLQTAVTIIDRFFVKVPYLPQAQLQLIGASSLNIAHKLQEVSVLPLDHFVSTCNYEFTRQQFIDMEQRICTCLGYSLCSVSIDVWMNLLMIQWDALLTELLETLEDMPKQYQNLFFKTKNNPASFQLFSAVFDYLDVAILNINFYRYPVKPLISAFMYLSLQNQIQRQHYAYQQTQNHQEFNDQCISSSLDSQFDQLDQIFKTFLIKTLGISEIEDISNELKYASQFKTLLLKRRQFPVEKGLTNKPNQIIIDPSKLPIYENFCSRQTYNIHGREFIGKI